MALTSNEPIGTTARLGVARLGATRLGACPDANNLRTLGRYAWTRQDTAPRGGDPPNSEDASTDWTRTRT
jgi:hypothetical protein